MPGTHKVTFANSRSDDLAASLDLPDGRPRAFALFAHCFTCSKDALASKRIAIALAARGFAVLRFDFTGLGGSGGDFANTDFSSNVADLVAAAEWLRDEHEAPTLLVGHSLGGAAVLAAAGRIREAVAVATIGAPADPDHIRRHLVAAEDEIRSEGEAEVEIGGRRFRIRESFLDDIASHKLEDAIAGLRKALLVMHAPRDAVVGIDNATAIFRAAKHPKSFVSLDDADHLLGRAEDARYVAEILAAWSSRWLPAPTRDDAQEIGEGRVLVAGAGEGRFAQTIRAGRHVLRADEPASVGGDGSGPGPYEFVLAGLGACTAMTLRMYAERKKWPLEDVGVVLAHDRIHAEDCADCETKEGKIDRITREVEITGDLDEAQRARLLEIADRCPVHRTLEGEIEIVTRAAGS